MLVVVLHSCRRVAVPGVCHLGDEMAAQFYADSELRRQLQACGVDVGPITDTTRSLYQRQLMRLSGRKRSRGQRPGAVGNAAKKVRLEEPVSPGSQVVVARKGNWSERVGRVSGAVKLPEKAIVHKLPSSPSPRVNVCTPLPRMPQMSPSPPSPRTSEPSPAPSSAGSPSQEDVPSGSGGLMSLMTNFIGEGVKGAVKKVFGPILEAATPRPSLKKRSPSFQSSRPSGASLGREAVPLDEVDVGDDNGIVVIPAAGMGSSSSQQANYDWELLPSDVEICRKSDGSLWSLGKGGFGEVFKGVKDGVDEVAVKVIRIRSGLIAIEQFKQEIDMISKLRHRHILQFYGACIQPSHLYMVTELMQTDLFSALRHDLRYQWTGVYGKEVVMGVASGLHYLHSRRPPVVHRDIKSPNILLMDGIAKIADVGIARTKAASDMTAQRGFTIAWAAPEVVYRKRATEKIDIWSFGIILWEIVSGRMPRPGQLALPAGAPAPLQALYSSCSEDDPNRRPTAADILKQLRVLD